MGRHGLIMLTMGRGLEGVPTNRINESTRIGRSRAHEGCTRSRSLGREKGKVTGAYSVLCPTILYVIKSTSQGHEETSIQIFANHFVLKIYSSDQGTRTNSNCHCFRDKG